MDRRSWTTLPFAQSTDAISGRAWGREQGRWSRCLRRRRRKTPGGNIETPGRFEKNTSGSGLCRAVSSEDQPSPGTSPQMAEGAFSGAGDRVAVSRRWATAMGSFARE